MNKIIKSNLKEHKEVLNQLNTLEASIEDIAKLLIYSLKGDKTILQPNVCFHMIAVMQFGDWGVEASEAIRVTENGSELFCNFPKELHIKS